MFTAEDARKLVETGKPAIMPDIIEYIKERASGGFRSADVFLSTSDVCSGPLLHDYRFFSGVSKNHTDIIIDELEASGFNCCVTEPNRIQTEIKVTW